MAGEWRLLLRYEAEAWGPFSVHSFIHIIEWFHLLDLDQHYNADC